MGKKSFLMTSMFPIALFSLSAEETYYDLVKVGDHPIMGSPSGTNGTYVDVPRKDFSIKNGGIVNIGGLKNNGTTFFNAYNTLKTDLNSTISNEDLRIPILMEKRELAK